VPLGGRPDVAQAARAALPYTAWAGFLDQYHTPEQFRAYAAVVLKHGHRLNTVVNERLDEILDILEELAAEIPLTDRQLVLQHLRVVSPAAVERMKRLRAVVTTQPASYIWKAGPETLARVGDGETIVPHRTLLDAGLPFVLSTDNKPYQPLFAIWAALARTARESGEVIGPGQVITREEALQAMTLDAARISYEEDRKGSIAAGKLADLVVFAQDPLTVPLAELPDVPAELTMIGGQIVHRAGGLA
jgi:predicted amidohydrolase YtcJ